MPKTSAMRATIITVMVLLSAPRVAPAELSLYWDTGDIGIVQDVAIADLDNDGSNEVLVALEVGGTQHHVFVYDGSSKTILDTIEIPSGYPNLIEVADIDADAVKEIVIGSIERQSPNGYVYVFDALSLSLEWTSDNLGEVVALHAADFDSDGEIEIFVGSNGPPVSPSYGPIGGRITLINGASHVIEYNDTTASGFKLSERSSWGNLDGDPALEIVFAANMYATPQSFTVHELDGQTHLSETRIDSAGAYGGSAIRDIDRDGVNEIVMAYRNGQSSTDPKRLVVLNADWGLEWSYSLEPIEGADFWSPAVANVNGHPALDIALGVKYESGHDSVIIIDGQTRDQIWSVECAERMEALTFGDVNSDGVVDLCIGTGSGTPSGRMRVYELGCGGPETVAVDIKPMSCPNPFELKPDGTPFSDLDRPSSFIVHSAATPAPVSASNKSVLPVAILGASDLDVTQVDPETVKLNGVSPLRWAIEDVAAPVGDDADECECTTAGSDGYRDLSLKFNRSALAATFGSVIDGQYLELTLTGNLLDGTIIEGSDCILIRFKGKGSLSGAEETPFDLGSYPNPFNAATSIRYTLDEPGDVNVSIYNVLGQRVATLANGSQSAGQYTVTWEATGVASGMYFYRLQVNGSIVTRKMLLLK